MNKSQISKLLPQTNSLCILSGHLHSFISLHSLLSSKSKYRKMPQVRLNFFLFLFSFSNALNPASAFASNQAPETNNQRIGLSSPELRERLLLVFKSRDGYITPKIVEKIFNRNLIYQPVFPPIIITPFYHFSPDEKLNFDISVNVPKRGTSYFSFSWHKLDSKYYFRFPPPPEGFCFDRLSIQNDVRMAGWSLSSHEELQAAGDSDSFTKSTGGYLTTLYHHNNPCLISFEMSSQSQ